MALIWQAKPVRDEATDDVAFLFEDDNRRAAILRILELLCQQVDPRIPKTDSGLDVEELRTAPGWFRVKVGRYAIRIVFRLVIVRDELMIEIKSAEPVPKDTDEKYIEIMQAGYRKDTYGPELRARYRKYHRDEPFEE
jgi:hypothetical protein